MSPSYCIVISLAVLLCSCVQATSRMRGGSTGSRLGESCEYDEDCDVTYTFCRAQQTCECKRGFEPAPTRDRCMATIGAICSSSYDCSGLTNSECSQEVCTCRPGYVPHPDMKECLQAASRYEGTCVENVQCTQGFGDRVECKDNKCQCIPMHHFVDNVCISSKALDQMCTDSRECRVSDTEDHKNKQVQCTAGRCQCIMGFHMAEDHLTCTDGAAQLPVLSLLIVSLVYCLTRLVQ